MLPVNLNSDPLPIDSAVSTDSVLPQYEKCDCLQPRSVSKLGRHKHVPMDPSSTMWEESGSYARLSCTFAAWYCDRNCASVKTSRHCKRGESGTAVHCCIAAKRMFAEVEEAVLAECIGIRDMQKCNDGASLPEPLA